MAAQQDLDLISGPDYAPDLRVNYTVKDFDPAADLPEEHFRLDRNEIAVLVAVGILLYCIIFHLICRCCCLRNEEKLPETVRKSVLPLLAPNNSLVSATERNSGLSTMVENARRNQHAHFEVEPYSRVNRPELSDVHQTDIYISDLREQAQAQVPVASRPSQYDNLNPTCSIVSTNKVLPGDKKSVGFVIRDYHPDSNISRSSSKSSSPTEVSKSGEWINEEAKFRSSNLTPGGYSPFENDRKDDLVYDREHVFGRKSDVWIRKSSGSNLEQVPIEETEV